MATEQDLTDALAPLMFRGDVVWLATRLRFGPEDERPSLPPRVEVYIRFFWALLAADCQEGIEVYLESHDERGRAIPRREGDRVFLEWDLKSESASQDGWWGAFTILALVPYEPAPTLWCWICDTVDEEDYAEAVFNWWHPQEYAFARGIPLFPERVASDDW